MSLRKETVQRFCHDGQLDLFYCRDPGLKVRKSFPLMEHTEACRQSDPKAAPEIRNIEVLNNPPRSGAIFFVVAPSLIH
jgi:hypothetical protein